MAKSIKSETLERTYNVPLRKEFQKVPRWKRSKKAVAALRQFLAKHMKSENVKLSPELNEEMWKHGIKNPPHHVKVSVTKDKDGVVKAELFDKKEKVKKSEQKKEAKKTKTKSDVTNSEVKEEQAETLPEIQE